MKRQLIIYSVAIGINRGAVLIYLPILVHSLSVADYGEFSYIQILFQLLFPLICLNIASGISREGADQADKGVYLYKSFWPYVLFATFSFSLLAFFLGNIFSYKLLVYIVLLGGMEALHNMQLSLFRVYEKHIVYASFTISKTIGFLILVYTFKLLYSINLMQILVLQVIWHFLIFLVFSLSPLNKINFNQFTRVKIKPILVFSLMLIPHIISQWAIGASNRIIVKHLLGTEVMGIYSIAYTLSMVLLLLQSGLATVLPQNFIKNPDLWLSPLFKAKFLYLYTASVLLTYFAMLLFLYINKFQIKIVNYGTSSIGYYFSILFSAFYILGYYYYYTNVLFLYKKAKWISSATLVTAIFSITCCFILTKYFQIAGAAISMLMTYIFYYISVFILATKLEARLSFNVLSDLIVPVFTVIAIILFGHYYSETILKEII